MRPLVTRISRLEGQMTLRATTMPTCISGTSAIGNISELTTSQRARSLTRYSPWGGLRVGCGRASDVPSLSACTNWRFCTHLGKSSGDRCVQPSFRADGAPAGSGTPSGWRIAGATVQHFADLTKCKRHLYNNDLWNPCQLSRFSRKVATDRLDVGHGGTTRIRMAKQGEWVRRQLQEGSRSRLPNSQRKRQSVFAEPRRCECDIRGGGASVTDFLSGGLSRRRP